MITTNRERAETVLDAIDAFNVHKHTVEVPDASLEPEDEDAREQLAEDIQDLINNLCHAARAAGLDPKEIVESAYGGFLSEEIDESGALDVVDVTLSVDEDALQRARQAAAAGA